jgi:sodium-dependent dicarboxylate transporter 2/3/5
VGFPSAIMMFPLVILAMWVVIRPEKNAMVNQPRGNNNFSMEWNAHAKGSVALFIFTVFCWIFSSQIGHFLGLKQFDRMIAIFITALAPILG